MKETLRWSVYHSKYTFVSFTNLFHLFHFGFDSIVTQIYWPNLRSYFLGKHNFSHPTISNTLSLIAIRTISHLGQRNCDSITTIRITLLLICFYVMCKNILHFSFNEYTEKSFWESHSIQSNSKAFLWLNYRSCISDQSKHIPDDNVSFLHVIEHLQLWVTYTLSDAFKCSQLTRHTYPKNINTTTGKNGFKCQ